MYSQSFDGWQSESGCSAEDGKVRNSNFLHLAPSHIMHIEKILFCKLSNTQLLQIRPNDWANRWNLEEQKIEGVRGGTYLYVKFVPIRTFTETTFTPLKDQRPQNLYTNVNRSLNVNITTSSLSPSSKLVFSSRSKHSGQMKAVYSLFIMFRYFLWVSLYVLE